MGEYFPKVGQWLMRMSESVSKSVSEEVGGYFVKTRQAKVSR